MIFLKNFIETGFLLGALFGAVLFLPQAYRLFRRKQAKQISLLTFLGFNLVQILVILHGVLHHDKLLIIGAASKFICCSLVTFLIIYYRSFHRWLKRGKKHVSR